MVDLISTETFRIGCALTPVFSILLFMWIARRTDPDRLNR